MQEIERKFLINQKKWIPDAKGYKVKQGYLSVDPERTVRVRIVENKAFITVKGVQKGLTRTELEYEIPLTEAEVLMKMCLDFPIEKTRYLEKRGGLVWEIDVFEGMNNGLCLAEVELEDENQQIELPEWIEEEVSENQRYFNSWLSKNPFSAW